MAKLHAIDPPLTVPIAQRPQLIARRCQRRNFRMSTTTEQNKAVIRRFIDAWNSRQPDEFDDLIAPDVVRHCEATPGVEARSLDQVKEFLRQDTAVFSRFCANDQTSDR